MLSVGSRKKSDVRLRLAAVEDAAVLDRLDEQLMQDEGRQNQMALPELEQRLAAWLAGE